MTTRAIRYLRCSSLSQASEDRLGLPRQRTAAMRTEMKFGLECAFEIHDIITGASAIDAREQLNRLPELAREHGANAVSLSEVDRLSRDLHQGHLILNALVQTELDIYANDLRGRVNVRDLESIKEFNARLQQASEERQRTRERTYGGRLEKALRGEPPNPLNAYGYRDGEINEAQAHWVRWIFERLQTRGLQTVAKELNKRGVPPPRGEMWRKTHILQIADNPTYIGRYLFGREGICTDSSCGERRSGTVTEQRRGYAICKRCGSKMKINAIEIPVEAIITPELRAAVDAARERRKVNHNRVGTRRDTFLLQGRIICGVCRKTMSGETNRGKHHYYFCRRATKSLESNHQAERCPHRRYYPVAPLHDAVREQLVRIFSDVEALEELLGTPPPPQRDYSEDRQRLMDKLQRVRDAYDDGVYDLPEMKRRSKAVEAELAAIPTPKPQPKRPSLATYQGRVNEALEGPLWAVMEAARCRVVVAPDGFELEFLV